MSERALIMTDEEFHLFRDFVYAQSHIYCAAAQRTLFEKKIRKNVEALALPSFQAYYDMLTRSPERARECTHLLESIAVHETSFFRISGHFNGLTEFVFPQLCARPEKTPIHLWSVGCSTGEEPYSIIMTFLEYQERRAAGAIWRSSPRIYPRRLSLKQSKPRIFSGNSERFRNLFLTNILFVSMINIILLTK